MPSPSFEYEFVRLSIGWRWFRRSPAEDYREIVESHAKRGWRLVQIFAPATVGYGRAAYFELIFERQV
jgi:hypothetical protein